MTRDFAYSVNEKLVGAIGGVSATLHEPEFLGNEWTYLKECLASTFVSSVGKFVDRFEGEIASFTGAKHAIAVVNGTAALHISLLLADVLPGDEVLISPLTFVGTANPISYCGGVPHFVDIEEGSLGIDPIKLRNYLDDITTQKNGICINSVTGKAIKALVPMHVFGHPSMLEELIKVAEDFNLALIEDSAESLGSYYKNQHTGTFGMLGILSFNGNKTITTGGGGAILTNDENLARKAKHLTTTAKIAHPWDFVHDEVGYNYRLPNLNAALGCAQLEQLSLKLEEKRMLFELYDKVFKDFKGARIMAEPLECKSNYWLQTLILDTSYADARDDVLEITNKSGLLTRPAWTLLSKLKPFQGGPKMNLDMAELMARRLVNIPSSPKLARSRNG
ncbi:WecE Predicted pyridoxal phosphate-dependent enzyme apparently involved in regulation of cell wall biogenesis [Burkholderiaceae bacterium]